MIFVKRHPASTPAARSPDFSVPVTAGQAGDVQDLSASPSWVSGLALTLACSALAACSSNTNSQDIAKGKDFSVSSGELNQALRKAPTGPQAAAAMLRRKVLETLIEETLLSKAAVTDGLDRDPRVLEDLEAAKRAILAQAYAVRLTAQVRAPSDEDVKTFYNSHPEAFAHRTSVDMDEVAFSGPPQIAGKYAKLFDKGLSINDVKAKAATEGVGVTAGHVVTTSEKLPTTFAQKISEIPAGTNVIFPVAEGVIYARIKQVTAAPLTLEQATPMIRSGIQIMRKDELLKNDLQRLRGKANIKILDPKLAPLPGKP